MNLHFTYFRFRKEEEEEEEEEENKKGSYMVSFMYMVDQKAYLLFY